jgi:hypothetical protein
MNEIVDYPFISGLELSRLLYEEAVRPLLANRFPTLVYSAALLGSGSEVLGFDTPQSMDHSWGPRLMLFLTEADFPAYQKPIDHLLRRELPADIHGIPTSLAITRGDPQVAADEDGTLPNHRVQIFTVDTFFGDLLKVNPRQDLSVIEWLTIPEQILRSVTAVRVFHDGLGELESIRRRLRYYPHDVWLYLLANQWGRIAQEEAFVGRCGQVGDELGSRLVAARLIRDLMRLCFLIEKQYAPYIKWLGSAFQQLACAEQLTPIFHRVLDAATWPEREKHLTAAYEFVALKHNQLGITESLPAKVARFHERPFFVIQAEKFADALRAAITGEELLALPPQLGSVDQFVDSTDVLSYPEAFSQFRQLYQSHNV